MRFSRYNFNRKKSFYSDLSITTWLIIITSLISIIAFVLLNLNKDLINYFALNPNLIFQGKYIWTLILHMFVHGTPLHLFVNMFVLFSLGRLSERIIGRKRYIWFYILSGLFAGLLSVIFSISFGNSPFGEKVFGSPNVYMVGASGAIFAIAGLFVMLLPRLKFAIIFFPFFTLPGYIMIPAILFVTWAVSILAGLPIGNVAHFGGFLAGISYGYYLKRKYSKKVQLLQKYFR
ncbi:rhomboid family intramembrane serine protease [Candidatus Pacearchaeota archaeon]|nr:rhomboid family intramembrane serine protease [Candidatus Pacearchaeota archaeon]